MARMAVRRPIASLHRYDIKRSPDHLGLAQTSHQSEASSASQTVDLWHRHLVLTDAPFSITRRPLWFHRMLHCQHHAQGNIRHRKEGTTAPWGFRKCQPWSGLAPSSLNPRDEGCRPFCNHGHRLGD